MAEVFKQGLKSVVIHDLTTCSSDYLRIHYKDSFITIYKANMNQYP